MDSYPNYNPDDERSYPAAPKGSSGPGDTPIGPDHNPPSGGYVPNDESWAGGAAFPLSSPYSGISSGEPPAPIFRPEIDGAGVGAARGGFPSRTDVGARNRPLNRRRALAGIGAFLLLVLVIGGIGFVLVGNGVTGHPTANGGNGGNGGGGAPVAVATDTPQPTPTLLPGQTPLPTAIPPTPLPPGATPPAYASSASVSFKRATQGLASSATVTVSTSAGDSRIKVTSVKDSVTSNVTATAPHNPGFAETPTLTVYNNDFADEQSPSQPVTGKDSQGTFVTCITQGTSKLIKARSNQYSDGSGTATQQCNEPTQYENQVTYNAGNGSISGFFTYSGTGNAGGQLPGYYVPSGCGTQGAVQAQAKSDLQSKINGEMGGTTVYLSLPDLSYSGFSCQPGQNQLIAGGGSNYTQTITATGSQAGYSPGGVSAYQQAQIGTTGAGWQIIGSNGCSPAVQGGASLSNATVACKATATEAWNAFNLGGMAQLIQGQDQASAKGSLNAVQGVVAGSETFSLSGGSYLPTSAGSISFHYSP